MLHGIQSLLRTDPRTFVRQLFKLTGGETIEGGYGETIAEEWLRRVPMECGGAVLRGARRRRARAMGERLGTLEVPMLLAQHKGCLMFTDEGFEDAVAAFPDAHVVSGATRSRARAPSSRPCCASSATQPRRRAGLSRRNLRLVLRACGARPTIRAMARTWQDVFITPNGAAAPRRGARARGAQRRGFFRRLRENLSKSP